jgi:hypothetical protein
MSWYWWLLTWVGVSSVAGVFLGRWMAHTDLPPSKPRSDSGDGETKSPERKVG